MGKKNKKGGGGPTGMSTAKFFLKLGAGLVGGAIIGEVISPITGPVSGPALGIAAVGLPLWGLKSRYLTHALAPAIAVQALKTASESKAISSARDAVAVAYLPPGTPGYDTRVETELERARRAAQG